MDTRLPTGEEIDEVVAFLPKLYEEGFAPIERWGGGTTGPDGAIRMPWPEYHKVVQEFVGVVSRPCWTDYRYHPGDARRMLGDEELVSTASIEQIKTMLTYFVRGERFGDGHWAAMIEDGHIRRLLERLREP